MAGNGGTGFSGKLRFNPEAIDATLLPGMWQRSGAWDGEKQ